MKRQVAPKLVATFRNYVEINGLEYPLPTWIDRTERRFDNGFPIVPFQFEVVGL